MWSAAGLVMFVGDEISALPDDRLILAARELRGIWAFDRRHDPRSQIGIVYRALCHEIKFRALWRVFHEPAVKPVAILGNPLDLTGLA